MQVLGAMGLSASGKAGGTAAPRVTARAAPLPEPRVKAQDLCPPMSMSKGLLGPRGALPARQGSGDPPIMPQSLFRKAPHQPRSLGSLHQRAGQLPWELPSPNPPAPDGGQLDLLGPHAWECGTQVPHCGPCGWQPAEWVVQAINAGGRGAVGWEEAGLRGPSPSLRRLLQQLQAVGPVGSPEQHVLSQGWG